MGNHRPVLFNINPNYQIKLIASNDIQFSRVSSIDKLAKIVAESVADPRYPHNEKKRSSGSGSICLIKSFNEKSRRVNSLSFSDSSSITNHNGPENNPFTSPGFVYGFGSNKTHFLKQLSHQNKKQFTNSMKLQYRRQNLDDANSRELLA
ncbi:hypothetical protein RND71_032225 [Anisodus tanguticus]|uniref:Uncharacterized protein n=1 Tax=Anisodus tanguticus TaxID=243964 RepID=A0AAE1RD87_9SOLA|nr:hypothetical protein RND71_032225 [Anisodus tanguticus]